MQRRQHHVARDGGAQPDLRRLDIAHFPDQDHVRILAQSRAQHAAEGQLDLLVDLDLVDAVETVFNRILHGDDLAVGLVQFVQRRVQGGRLAAAGGPGDEHHPRVTMDRAAEALEQFRRHAEIGELMHASCAVEQAHDDRFAVLRRHGGNAYVYRMIPDLDVEAAVLGQATLGDIEPRHQLEALGHGRGYLGVGLGLRLQEAVDPEADVQCLLVRFDVNIGCPCLNRVLEHRLEQLDDRGIFCSEGEGPEVHDVAQILAQLPGERTDLVGAPVDAIDGLQQGRFGHHCDVDFLAGKPRDLVEGKQVRGIDHRNQHHVVLLFEQKRAEAP